MKKLLNILNNELSNQYYKYLFSQNTRKKYLKLIIVLLFLYAAWLFGYKFRDAKIFVLEKTIKIQEHKKASLESDIAFLEDELIDYNKILKDGDYYRYMAFKHSDITIPKHMNSDDLILIHRTSKKFNVPYRIIYRLIQKESRYNPKAKSQVGASGYMQVMPATFKRIKYRYEKKYGNIDHLPYNQQNILVGTFYLNYLYKMYNDWNLTLSAYNAGPGNVNKKIPNISETKNYVKFINK